MLLQSFYTGISMENVSDVYYNMCFVVKGMDVYENRRNIVVY